MLISTKTMLSSYQKNLRNRFEEGYGDAKNLRGRHPLASLGFLFIAGSDIPPTSLAFAIDMLRKLTSEPDVYDCACLLIVEGAQGAQEDDDRTVEEEPSALLPLHDPLHDDDDGDAAEEPPKGNDAETRGSIGSVSVLQDLVPRDLGADHFFEQLISGALERMPVTVYPMVRERRAEVME